MSDAPDNDAELPEEPSARAVYLINAGDLCEHAGRYLDEVREAIDATPLEDHRRPAMLALKVAHAQSCSQLAAVLVELATLDEVLDDDDDDDEYQQAALELDEPSEVFGATVQKCGAASHAGSSLQGRTCGRRLNHRGMHAQRDSAGELVQW